MALKDLLTGFQKFSWKALIGGVIATSIVFFTLAVIVKGIISVEVIDAIIALVAGAWTYKLLNK